ncbi:MAG: sugar ABC transporter ATP-binding protein [Pseudomonadota bacterium]
MKPQLCRIDGLEKAFGHNRVLRAFSLDLNGGEVTALMGANGAGKSTLVKILSGVYRRDAGSIALNGQAFLPETPAQAMRQGVVTVHQHINDGVIPDLDVASNLLIDRLAEPSYGFLLRRGNMFREARKIADTMGLQIDVRAPVSSLGVADRQLIAIARAMSHEPSLLILDEPTSSLSASEAEQLFALVDTLKRQGVAILYISHRMSDIRRIADRIVSMRDGEVSGVFEGQNLDYEGAVHAMLGHTMTDVDIDVPQQGEPILTLQDTRLKEGAAPFDLTLHDNEVVVVTGLLGSGKTALAQSLFGLSKIAGGQITLNGQTYRPRDPQQAIARGVFMSAKDRADNAIVADFDISRNMSLPFLPQFSTAGFIKRREELTSARHLVDALAVVCQSEGDDINTLSGGNQQKVMLARWLSQSCKLLLLDEPFQGVDIRSRRDIGAKIRSTSKGRATLVFVAELDEAFEVADRIVVMHDHSIVAEFINRNVDLNAVLAAVTGSTQDFMKTGVAA